MPTITETERQDALKLLQAANLRMADRAEPPRWYHLALGVLVGGLVAVQEAPMIWRAAYFAVYALGLVLLVQAYRKHTGMWVPGYRAGRTRWVAVGGAALALALISLAVWAHEEAHLRGAYLAAGALVAIIVTAMGYIWQWAYRRDLGEV